LRFLLLFFLTSGESAIETLQKSLFLFGKRKSVSPFDEIPPVKKKARQPIVDLKRKLWMKSTQS
jgi:hypothetical protein